MSVEIHIDAMLPQEMADKAEAAGVRKAAMPFQPLIALAVLAGAFVALGAMFATTAVAAASTLPYGLVRLLFGLGLLPWLDPGCDRRRRAVHRE